ncbi:MAG: tetratricopeptide repeat protein [Candidatus Latescibacterota bacterium]
MLKKPKRLTKKELKKDPLVLLSAQALDFLRAEWIKVGSIVLAVVVISLIAVLIVNGKKKGEINAHDAAMIALQNNAPEATDLLKKIVNKYGGSRSAADALIQLGNRFYIQKDLNNSEKYYKEYIDKYSEDPVYGFNAFNNLGSIYEEKGDFKKAAGTYEKYIQKYKTSMFNTIMYLNAGKAYIQAGDKESAKKNLTAIVQNFPDSREKEEASFYLESLN